MDQERQTIETVRRVGPAVVSITITKLLSDIRKMQLSPSLTPHGKKATHKTKKIDDGDPNSKVAIGGGSGFIVHHGGLVMTNKHVVIDPDAEYTVILSDEREFPARVVSRDPINDVAFLKIEAERLPILELGNSDDIELGQSVIAIGNALGLFTNTVSKGIISGLGRKVTAALGDGGMIEQLRHVIQTDVAINQGNSGGPLVNLDGFVVGINTAIIYGAQNICFAIPINWAKSDLEDLRKSGRIVKPYLGVKYIMLTPEIAKKFKLSLETGALVLKDHIPGAEAVIANSPAAKAGIKEHDVITAINGTLLDKKTEVADIIDALKVDATITIDFERGDQKHRAEAILEERK